MKNNLRYLMVGTYSFLGCLCIISGLTMPHFAKSETSEVVKLSVTQKKVANCKSNEIKLKDISLEVTSSLSTDSHDYLSNPNDIEESIIKRLKLDTSNVNTNEVGTYTYTITYNKKIYNGTVVVKQKALPQVDVMTLNALSYEVNTTLPTDISNYVKENLSDEVKAGINIDLSNVDISKPGSYLYSISYNGKLYTNTITIYEPKSGTDIITNKNNKDSNIENKKDNS